VLRERQENQRIRGIGAGRRPAGTPERRSVRSVVVRGAGRRRLMRRFGNMDVILRRIFLGSKFSGRIFR
jgi:hypothetical protein